jgi:hypothetical protein
MIPNQTPKYVGVETVCVLHNFGRKKITVYTFLEMKVVVSVYLLIIRDAF